MQASENMDIHIFVRKCIHMGCSSAGSMNQVLVEELLGSGKLSIHQVH